MRLIVASALLLGACSQTVVPVSDIRPFRPITMSCKDTPDTRTQIVRHNSVLDSLKSGKDVVYRDDCPAKKEPPKTS
jgi:hypothetical protein